MADIVDQAAITEEQTLDAALRAARQPLPAIEATGECLYCGDALTDARRWCNADCRDGWQREQDAVAQRKSE